MYVGLHDIELVEIRVWWTMPVCFVLFCFVFFFFHPTGPKYREIKMEKQKTNKNKKIPENHIGPKNEIQKQK